MTIQDYLWDHRLKLKEFAEIVGMSYSFLTTIKNTTNPSINLSTAQKIWEKTEKRFGEGQGLVLIEFKHETN